MTNLTLLKFIKFQYTGIKGKLMNQIDVVLSCILNSLSFTLNNTSLVSPFLQVVDELTHLTKLLP